MDRGETGEANDRAVKGHDRVEGNEMVDARAKREVWMGKRMDALA